MNGRIRPGWYRHPDYDLDHVLRVVRTQDAWLATLWSRGAVRPCAAGTILSTAEWASLEPADPIPEVSDAADHQLGIPSSA